jgi:fumarylacetoacetate (FAA) hydrolase
MKLATLNSGHPRDGQLVVVSSDGSHCLAPESVHTLQDALENWPNAEKECRVLEEQLANGMGTPIDSTLFMAPLPRAWQWLDGSAFDNHGDLMQKAFNHEPLQREKPLMYQGMSHRFYGPYDRIPFPREEDGIDFEAEFGVIVDDVPMGTSADEALSHIKLLVMINDWSLRHLAIPEMNTGFGWIQAKPACSMAPFAVTPDEAGNAWKDGRLHLDLAVSWNDEPFGHPNGREMSVGFHELIAHAAATRDLCAGTVIGSGTVSNANYRETGSTCISERRGIEIIDHGKPATAYMKFGDRIHMQTCHPDSTSLFGTIDQQVTSGLCN